MNFIFSSLYFYLQLHTPYTAQEDATNTFTMSKSNAPMYLGLAAAGAGGYYLYKAGGDPKAAGQDMKCTISPLPPGFL